MSDTIATTNGKTPASVGAGPRKIGFGRKIDELTPQERKTAITGYDLRARIEALVAGVTGKSIKTTFHGDGACTGEDVMILPSIPQLHMFTKEEAMVLLGYTAHEISHQLETDFEMIATIFADINNPTMEERQLKEWWNAIEDYRIEKLTRREFPGFPIYIGATRHHTAGRFVETVKTGPVDPEVLSNPYRIGAVGLTWVGAILNGYPTVANDEALRLLDDDLESWLRSLAPRLSQVETKDEALGLAREILDELKQSREDQDSDKSDDDDSSNPQSSSNQTTADDKSDANDQDKEDDEPETDDDQDSSDGQGDGQDDDQDSDQDGKSNAEGANDAESGQESDTGQKGNAESQDQESDTGEGAEGSEGNADEGEAGNQDSQTKPDGNTGEASDSGNGNSQDASNGPESEQNGQDGSPKNSPDTDQGGQSSDGTSQDQNADSNTNDQGSNSPENGNASAEQTANQSSGDDGNNSAGNASSNANSSSRDSSSSSANNQNASNSSGSQRPEGATKAPVTSEEQAGATPDQSDLSIEEIMDALSQITGVLDDAHTNISEGMDQSDMQLVRRSQKKYSEVKRTVGSSAARASGVVKRLLMARNTTRTRRNLEQGRLDLKRLVPIVNGSPNIYTQTHSKKDINSAVSILLDNSGSMGGEPLVICQKTAVVLDAAVSGTGTDLEITGFTGSAYHPTIYRYRSFGQKGQSAAATLGNMDEVQLGGTPVAVPILEAHRRLMANKAPRKVMIVVSDGGADDQERAKEAHDIAVATGCIVIGLGVGPWGAAIKNWCDNSQHIQNIGELPKALAAVVQNALTPNMRKAA